MSSKVNELISFDLYLFLRWCFISGIISAPLACSRMKFLGTRCDFMLLSSAPNDPFCSSFTRPISSMFP